MCGIAGWAGAKPSDNEEAVLSSMLLQIRHRGPDGDGTYFASAADGTRIGLGHRRLSIIDVAGGAQPMIGRESGIALTYNGEIYNYIELREELKQHGCRFETQSDTEVIIKAYEHWGTDCFRRFRGMFALAIWDPRADEVVLARDHFGKKPLYIYEKGGTLVFASEVSAIVTMDGFGSGLDCDSVYDYIRYRYVPGDHTFFENIKKLSPGHFLVFKQGKSERTRFFRAPYDDPTIAESAGALSPEELEGGFLDVLEESVRLRMRSDVPYGAFLSGGLDSSAIVALMSRNSANPIKTFSIGFNEEKYSELPYARLVAEEFATEHTEVVINPFDITEHFDLLTNSRGGPITEPADVPLYILSAHAAKEVKVVLSGEGSDESLAGYPKHMFEAWAGPWDRYLGHSHLNRIGRAILNAAPSDTRRAKIAWDAITEAKFEDRMATWFSAFNSLDSGALAPGMSGGRCSDPTPFTTQPQWSALRKVLHFDQTRWLPDNLLERGDRMTMAASLEARMPFMDTVLARFIASAPDSALIRGRQSKYLLRKTMSGVLPEQILTRKKVGFTVPLKEWFVNELRDYTYDHLCGESSFVSSLLNRKLIGSIVDEHQNNRANNDKKIWSLLTLEMFLRAFRKPLSI